MTVTVQAGARVRSSSRRCPHGMTLMNYASIASNRSAGSTGRGPAPRRVPPLDETVTKLKLVTPGKKTIELSEDDEDPSTFRMARWASGLWGSRQVSAVR